VAVVLLPAVAERRQNLVFALRALVPW